MVLWWCCEVEQLLVTNYSWCIWGMLLSMSMSVAIPGQYILSLARGIVQSRPWCPISSWMDLSISHLLCFGITICNSSPHCLYNTFSTYFNHCLSHRYLLTWGSDDSSVPFPRYCMTVFSTGSYSCSRFQWGSTDTLVLMHTTVVYGCRGHAVTIIHSAYHPNRLHGCCWCIHLQVN